MNCDTNQIIIFLNELFYQQYCRKIKYINNRKNAEYCQDNKPGPIIDLPLVMIMWLHHWQSANANSYWYQQTPLHLSFTLFIWIMYFSYIFSVQLKEKEKVTLTYIIHQQQLKNSCLLPPMKHTILIINLKLKTPVNKHQSDTANFRQTKFYRAFKLPRTVYSSNTILSKASLQGWSGCQKSDLSV